MAASEPSPPPVEGAFKAFFSPKGGSHGDPRHQAFLEAARLRRKEKLYIDEQRKHSHFVNDKVYRDVEPTLVTDDAMTPSWGRQVVAALKACARVNLKVYLDAKKRCAALADVTVPLTKSRLIALLEACKSVSPKVWSNAVGLCAPITWAELIALLTACQRVSWEVWSDAFGRCVDVPSSRPDVIELLKAYNSIDLKVWLDHLKSKGSLNLGMTLTVVMKELKKCKNASKVVILCRSILVTASVGTSARDDQEDELYELCYSVNVDAFCLISKNGALPDDDDKLRQLLRSLKNFLKDRLKAIQKSWLKGHPHAYTGIFHVMAYPKDLLGKEQTEGIINDAKKYFNGYHRFYQTDAVLVALLSALVSMTVLTGPLAGGALEFLGDPARVLQNAELLASLRACVMAAAANRADVQLTMAVDTTLGEFITHTWLYFRWEPILHTLTSRYSGSDSVATAALRRVACALDMTFTDLVPTVKRATRATAQCGRGWVSIHFVGEFCATNSDFSAFPVS